jgi:hypothetical protein
MAIKKQTKKAKDDGTINNLVVKKKVRLTLMEDLLGTASANPTLHDDFIASKAPDAATRAEEIEALGVADVVEKSMTIFPRKAGKPILWDYQIKGAFKDACGMLSRARGTKSNALKAYKKIIDGLIFVAPRQIVLNLPEGTKVEECQRPIRVQTPQGERVAIAHSESVPAGTTLEFEISWFPLKGSKGERFGLKASQIYDQLDDIIDEWLNYGALRGLGQWRNSGKGRYNWEMID